MARAPATPARSGLLSRHIRDAIEAEILDGSLAPGARIDETAISRRFDASRTPVREALQALNAAGLITLQPRAGAVVAQLDLRRQLETLQVIAALEGLATRLAARRITLQELRALTAANTACAEAAGTEDMQAFNEANDRFHDLIFAAARNEAATEVAHGLRARLAPYRRFSTMVAGRMRASIGEHAAVIEAISNGDADLSETAMRSHLDRIGESITEISLSRGQAGFAAALA